MRTTADLSDCHAQMTSAVPGWHASCIHRRMNSTASSAHDVEIRPVLKLLFACTKYDGHNIKIADRDCRRASPQQLCCQAVRFDAPEGQTSTLRIWRSDSQ